MTATSSGSSPPKHVLIWTGSIVGVFLVAFVRSTSCSPIPSTGNAHDQLGARHVRRQERPGAVGQLDHPFSNNFVLRTLDWPGTGRGRRDRRSATDLFGFLPGAPVGQSHPACATVRSFSRRRRKTKTKTTLQSAATGSMRSTRANVDDQVHHATSKPRVRQDRHRAPAPSQTAA